MANAATHPCKQDVPAKQRMGLSCDSGRTGQETPFTVLARFVEQSALDSLPRSELVHEEVDWPLMDRARWIVIDGGPRYHSARSLPDEERGLMRKFADACLDRIWGRRFGDTFYDRLRD